METTQNTIGLSELLDEVVRDLEDFRKKHPTDYQLKTITMWWELERERLLVRHADKSVQTKVRWRLISSRYTIWFLAGWSTVLIVASVLRSV